MSPERELASGSRADCEEPVRLPPSPVFWVQSPSLLCFVDGVRYVTAGLPFPEPGIQSVALE